MEKVRQSEDSELVVLAMQLPETTLAAGEAGPQLRVAAHCAAGDAEAQGVISRGFPQPLTLQLLATGLLHILAYKMELRRVLRLRFHEYM